MKGPFWCAEIAELDTDLNEKRTQASVGWPWRNASPLT
jgi:hypothetical protein